MCGECGGRVNGEHVEGGKWRARNPPPSLWRDKLSRLPPRRWRGGGWRLVSPPSWWEAGSFESPIQVEGGETWRSGWGWRMENSSTRGAELGEVWKRRGFLQVKSKSR